MVKDNLYVTIQGWMMNLGLSLEETMIYAIIWQFSCDGKSSFVGNRAFLEEWVGKDKSTVCRYLRTLKKKGLIEYNDSGKGKAFTHYRVVLQNTTLPLQNTTLPLQNTTLPLQNTTVTNNNINLNIKDIKNADAFDFYGALLEIGVTDQTATDWMTVRKKLKASNTLTAFKTLVSEIEKSGKTPEECVAYAAANSWRGFKAEWLSDEKSPAPKVISTEDYFRMREEGKL